jgi:uncharacterized paraquat-inducible protein A
MVALNVISLILLGILTYQDFKNREVSVILMLMLFVLFCIGAFKAGDSLRSITVPFFVNATFIAVQLLGVATYFSIKHKKIMPLFDTYIGLGDVVFFCVCCMAFSTANFILFYLASLLIALASTLIYKKLKQIETIDIPLVGYMSIALLCCIVYKMINRSFGFYDDSFFLNMLN